MSNNVHLINEYLVDLFNRILAIEEKSLQQKGLCDLSMTEVHTLEKIGRGHAKTMTAVARSLQITVGTLTTAISRLVKKGYVHRYRDSGDRRRVLIELTDKGLWADQVHADFHADMVEKLTQDLRIQEDEALMKSLLNLKNFFEHEYKQ